MYFFGYSDHNFFSDWVKETMDGERNVKHVKSINDSYY